MINPQINIGHRALGFVGIAIIFILVKIIGDRFGYTGVSIFLSLLFGAVVIFIIYWLIKITIIVKESYKEAKDDSKEE
ncbi:MAG: hypothetical protein M0R20_03715 [Candidatus Omnitrophica bacterium]|jgi:hypothetical protein|nr:hypothetical protein [Candidatus Omnitrophota bacterium]